MRALHKVFRVLRHVVTQIVETELVVCAEGNVGKIGFAALRTVGLMLIDAIHTQAVEHIDRAHPLGVTLCQIVVDGDDVNAIACKSIQEDGECGGKCLTFTREHLGNLALMKHRATEELNVEVYHVPLQIVSASHPVIVIDSLVVLNIHKVVFCCKVAVKVVCSNFHRLVCGKEFRSTLNDSENFCTLLVESLFEGFENVLLQLVNLSEDGSTVLYVGRWNLVF